MVEPHLHGTPCCSPRASGSLALPSSLDFLQSMVNEHPSIWTSFRNLLYPLLWLPSDESGSLLSYRPSLFLSHKSHCQTMTRSRSKASQGHPGHRAQRADRKWLAEQQVLESGCDHPLTLQRRNQRPASKQLLRRATCLRTPQAVKYLATDTAPKGGIPELGNISHSLRMQGLLKD